MERQKHEIDATNKAPGVLASEVSVLLRGKHKPGFAPHKDEGDEVVIKNPEKMKITIKKGRQKRYYRHSGYMGGIKETRLADISPADALRRAVWGMLPKTKLRPEQIKRLRFESSEK